MKSQFTQKGVFSLVIMLPVFLLVITMIIINGIDDSTQFTVLAIVLIIFLISILTFYKLTIVIDESFISFSLGAGLIRKRYPLESISSCIPVKNNILYGIGIRWIPGGWLYNVSGLYAVELRFKNSKSVVRIGTDQPVRVAEAINARVNPGAHSELSVKKNRSGYYLAAVVLTLAVFMPALIILSGTGEIRASAGKNSLTIRGMYGIEVPYSEITSVDTVTAYPAIRRRTNGFAAGKSLKGNFRLADGSAVKLFVTQRNPPYIKIGTKQKTVILNFKNPDTTRSFFKKMRDSLEIAGLKSAF